MRVSERYRYNIVGDRIENAKDKNAQMLEKISTQKEITKISDDPIGNSQTLKLTHTINEHKQFRKNIDFSKGFLERTESAIGGIGDNLIRAKELAVAMVNDTYGPTSREATAREIQEIIDEVLQLGNSSYGGRFVFSGFRTQSPAVNPEGQYMGDDGVIFVQLSPDQFRQINLQARNFFEATPEERGQGHFDLIQNLKLLHQGLNENDKKMMQTALSELDFQLEKTTSYQAVVGAIWNSLDSANKRIELEEELAVTNRSKIEDSDVFKSSSDFKRTETILQSTLLASNKLLQPSLMNFMQ